MDEVHYLADRFRGAVWEEVIIHLPDVGAAGLAVGDGEQRRGVRRLAGHRARRHRGGRRASTGRCRCGSTCWSAAGCSTCSHDGRRGRRATTVNPELRAARPRRRPARLRAARRGRAAAAAAAARPARRASAPPPAPRSSTGWTARACCRRSPSSSAGPAATPPSQQCLRAGLRLTTAERARRDPRGSSRRARADIAARGPATCSATGSGSTALERGVAAHHAGHAAGVQGGRRGAVRPRPGQGGLRHRDPGAGHQHAGPLRGARAAGQVQRRGPRRRHAGGVHPAHRPGRPARHRRRGPRGRRCGSPGVDPRPVAGLASHPHLPAALQLPADATTWPSTWSASSAATRARELLESSFAQFQADRAVVGLARQVRRNEEALDGLRARR